MPCDKLRKEIAALADLARKLGQEIKAQRASRGFTQAQLAEAANLSEEWVRKIERGDGAPSLDTIEALATGLKVEVASLFAAPDAEARQRDRINAMLCDLDEATLHWVEAVLKLLLSRPQ